jgi:hypothetical protein
MRISIFREGKEKETMRAAMEAYMQLASLAEEA